MVIKKRLVMLILIVKIYFTY